MECGAKRSFWICPICGEDFNYSEFEFFYQHLRFDECLKEEEIEVLEVV